MADSITRTGRIFISYRRQETAYPAGWLFDRLVDHYGDGHVFKDVDSVEPGDDFVDVLSNAVGSCEVLLALIGEEWATIADDQGRRRLDSPDDFVRVEIEVALERDILVIPILVDGAALPSVEQLPPTLTRLVRRQALELSPSRFEYDINRLLKVLDKTLGTTGSEAVLDLREPSDGAARVPPLPLPRRPTPDDAPPPELVAPPPADPSPEAGRRPWHLIAVLAAVGLMAAGSGLIVWSQLGSETSSTPDLAGDAAKVATIKVGRGSSSVAIGPKDVWVSNFEEGTVSQLDPATDKVLTTIPVGQTGGDVVACPDAAWVISDTRFVARIDAATTQVTDRFPISSQVIDLAVRCGDSTWASGMDGTISRIRQGGTTVERFVSAARDPITDIDVDPQGVLWMSHTGGSAVLRLDPATRKIQRIPVGPAPIGLTAAQLDAVWVTSSDGDTVTRIDPASNKVVRTFAVGRRPWGAAVGHGALWTTNLGGDSVSRVDIATGTVTMIGVGNEPDGIAVGHGAVWVANGGSGTVSKIT